METYTKLKELTNNPGYPAQRQQNLSSLTTAVIDAPIAEIIHQLNTLPFCFTLQSCFGHFLFQEYDSHTLAGLPADRISGPITYRIAYITLCVENSLSGRKLLTVLNRIPEISPENIQFCCAEWFWEQQVNTYVLQVEPDRFKHQDTALLHYDEAVEVETARNIFFKQIADIAYHTPENTPETK